MLLLSGIKNHCNLTSLLCFGSQGKWLCLCKSAQPSERKLFHPHSLHMWIPSLTAFSRHSQHLARWKDPCRRLQEFQVRQDWSQIQEQEMLETSQTKWARITWRRQGNQKRFAQLQIKLGFMITEDQRVAPSREIRRKIVMNRQASLLLERHSASDKQSERKHKQDNRKARFEIKDSCLSTSQVSRKRMESRL